MPETKKASKGNVDYVAPEESNAAISVMKFLGLLALILVLAIFIRMFVFSPFEIPSGSMENTILPSDMVFSEKVSYKFKSPEAGEIVTFADPHQEGRTLIKRVIATEGQTVDLQDGSVFVDGKKLEEPYTKDSVPSSYPLSTASGVDIEYPYKVPEGEIWVMGDNRTESADSRYFGSVPVSSVSGHANFRYWPPDRVGPLE